MTTKFRSDLVWNYASLVVLAVSGIFLPVLVARAYDAATFGAFNQVFAAYIVSSMLASGGLNYSVLRAVAEHSTDPTKLRAIVAGALVPGFFLSVLTAGALYAAAGFIADLLGSPAMIDGLRIVSAGVFFFALNKVLLAVVNGLGRMRAYAVYQALRYLLIIGALTAAVAAKIPGSYLPGIFTAAELVLFAVLVAEVSSQIAWWRAENIADWSKDHLIFAAKGVASGVLVELNSRVDVLLLGWFLSDAMVGVYSFAAVFAEGFFQLLVVLQNIYHPILARHLASGRFAELEQLIRDTRFKIYAATGAVAVVSALAFPLCVWVLVKKPEYHQSQQIYAILVAGITVAAGYLPFQNTLFMANRPGWHTIYMSSIVLLNAAGNIILIPIWGIQGSALATGISFALSAPILYFMVRKIVGLKI